MRCEDAGRVRNGLRVAAALALAAMLGGGVVPVVHGQEVKAPVPTVPQIFTLMGQFVRVAYNNQGYVTLGYRVAQQSIGEEWLMLEVGLTVLPPAGSYTLKREHFKLKTPDGALIDLATQKQYGEAGYLPAIDMKAKVVRDSINYFPIDADRPCALSFFANISRGTRQLSRDDVELSSDRGCVGRLFFKVPGGIKVGQHWLIVTFGESEVQVPFRILTKEEAKAFSKSWEDIKEQHDASYKQKD
jgi:hypothetical protein